jgi:NADPH-dependent curcumin reductase CurA
MTARACARSTRPACRCSAYLGVLGMPSFTAWYGIRHICKPKAGETVFVSAATGAVGQVAGQLAKLAGAKVVGCAGDEDKCVWAVREAGYDACFNHRAERDYGAVLDKLCPQGIDADFENVGGKLFHAVFERMNNFGRIAFCGAISEYQDTQPMAGPSKMFSIVQKRLTLQGFIVSDHVALMGDFVNDVAPLLPLRQTQEPRDRWSRAEQSPAGLHRLCSRARTSGSWW